MMRSLKVLFICLVCHQPFSMITDLITHKNNQCKSRRLKSGVMTFGADQDQETGTSKVITSSPRESDISREEFYMEVPEGQPKISRGRGRFRALMRQ
ncbi:hypothetical protein J437_LFUL017737, partial [Ladona fulva]